MHTSFVTGAVMFFEDSGYSNNVSGSGQFLGSDCSGSGSGSFFISVSVSLRSQLANCQDLFTAPVSGCDSVNPVFRCPDG